ncbi:hypothetical protein OAE72_00530 [Akkermansiaceae bacterium]|nr:hypothetical protein [Akkermansiaceae bacterium]MDB4422662.1 hypothetical protein [bacterium]MDA7929613.1 hypothetical protein [Akkermansiaceae bacterium]MDB4488705.1 hypothetical protein [Akkermansiaceae bacterium]MDB4680416.1 hypothetical protein [Akkermansiaceae bacterium]
MLIRALFFLLLSPALLAEGQQYKIQVRASKIDPKVKSYPKIGFVLKDGKGKPQDIQNASVDTAVAPKGQLAIWLMAPKQELFDRLNSYGIHAIQVHYARQWFSKCCQQRPVSEHCRGNMRLEAATGEDHSDEADIAVRDSIKGRALSFVKYLDKENPEGNWGQFLNKNKTDLDWEKVILTGASHGSTTASRLAKHTKVARVVAFCGPRDQYQAWQGLPSKTPANRFFGFSHVKDMGWEEFHYQRSWEMLGLHKFGPIVDVDKTNAPYGNTRRLVTDFDVNNDANRAHSSVTPGSRSFKGPNGRFMHEEVWRYLFTHPVEAVGKPVLSTNAARKIKPQKVK